MPYTVWGAFDKFRTESVDLDPTQTKTARSSRDFLLDQLKTIAQNDILFPKLSGRYIPFGSFARSTKIRPLDDIDLLIPLVGSGTRSDQSPSNPYIYWLKITDNTAPLAIFPDEHGYVNSTKILNKFKNSLSKVKYYQKAEIKKTMQAVTLNLISYDWVFDIVPAVPVDDGRGGIAYYLIPDGHGEWIRTDPRVDDRNTTKVNTQHGSKFLPTMRLLKYWNNRTHKPRLMSYYFETLAIKVFEYATKITDFPQAIKYFFDMCPAYLATSCPDPKNLGPSLDTNVDSTTKQKVSAALSEAATFAGYALMYEQQSKNQEAIYWWGRIFGPNFPGYG